MGDVKTAASTETVNILPQDGCVLLGDRPYGDHHYVTRYRVRHGPDRRPPAHTVRDHVCPFAAPGAGVSCIAAVWSLVRADLVVISAWILVIALGCVKEVFSLRAADPSLHLGLSAAENALAVTIIGVRIGGACTWYRDAQRQVVAAEHVTASHTVKVHGAFRALVLFVSLALLLAVCVGGLFSVTFFFSHLGWTVLTANAGLVITHAAYSVFCVHIGHILASLQIDQHKAVLCEAVLLLKEGIVARTRDEKVGHFRRADRFLMALKHTKLFRPPDWVGVVDGFDYETIALKELETSV